MRKLLSLLAVMFLTTGCMFATIDEGERGVSVTFGEMSDTVLNPGLHFKWPLIETIETMSVRVHKMEDTAGSSSKDLQLVNIVVTVQYSLDPDKIPFYYSKYGSLELIEDKIIGPANEEAIKASSAKFTAENMIVQREELSTLIEEVLREELKSYGLSLTGVKLKNIDFTDKFDQAVEDKQIEEQKALKALHTAEKAKNEAQAVIYTEQGVGDAAKARAQGLKEANDILQKSLSPQILQKQFLDKWDGKLPVVMGGQDNSLLLNLPLPNSK